MNRQEEETEALPLVSVFNGEIERYVRSIYLQGLTHREAAERDGMPGRQFEKQGQARLDRHPAKDAQ